jgi:hypothetical protein
LAGGIVDLAEEGVLAVEIERDGGEIDRFAGEIAFDGSHGLSDFGRWLGGLGAGMRRSRSRSVSLGVALSAAGSG